jgi:hypothetical protein
MARRRWGFNHKLSVPCDAFSRATIRLETRRASPTKSRQAPEARKKISLQKHSKRYNGASRNLTSQHLANELNDTNKKGVAFLKMYDFGHQTRNFILKKGYLFHQAARLAGVVQSSFFLKLHQS